MEAEKVFKKLRLDKAESVLIVNAPEEFTTVLSGITYDSKPVKKKEGNYDFVLLFAITQARLEKMLKELVTAGKYDCLFWIGYPKMSGKIKSDIKRETAWPALELVGMETVTSIAIDETWTALRARPKDKVGK